MGFWSGGKQRVAVCMLATVLGATLAGPASAFWAPPPEPAVAPLIGSDYHADADGTRVADALENRVAEARQRAMAATSDAERQAGQAMLDATVPVELIFKKQITQGQINAFQALGGRIDYVYRSVSYGWNGSIPLGIVAALPAMMGDSLVVVEEPKEVVLHMDLATRTGRVRPIWAAGFAGSPGGFSGSPDITIAIIDSGVDGTHTDLSGNQQFWKDYTSDNLATAQDLGHHGSHVAGIALGSGASAGSATGTLYYTDQGDHSSTTSGSFFTSPIGLPGVWLTFTSTARWLGGGSTDLYLAYHTTGSSGNYVAQSAATFGASPVTESNTFTPNTSRAYTTALLAASGVGKYCITNAVTNYPGVGDGFNKFRGVAPDCRWAGAKVFTNAGSGSNTNVNAAIDELVALRALHNVKVMNLSLGTIGDPGIDTSQRQKVNSAVNNGVVVVVSAGNDGQRSNPAGRRAVDDPGRAAMVLTVASSNDVNTLTDYSSHGFSNPSSASGQQEDYKPDLMAPGGSAGYYTSILSVDSNTGDGNGAFADQQPNDYYNIQGTSMASPFAAGCAALVIDAMQQAGVSWSFASGVHSKYVKMVLCATANESNANRESGNYNPTLQRAAGGPSGFPAGKDQYEGYGMINPDAAVEAVSLTYAPGSLADATLGAGATDRRVWARTVHLAAAEPFSASLAVPATGDFDLYLYSSTPSNYGTPVILASSTNAGSGAAEAINYIPPSTTNVLLVVKRVTGFGTFTLASTGVDTIPPEVASVSASNPDGLYGTGSTIGVQVIFGEPVTVTGVPRLALATSPARFADYVSGSGTTTLLFNYVVSLGDVAADLDYASTSALTLNGGTIRDLADNPALLTLPTPGTPGSLGANRNIAIAGVPGDFDGDGDVDLDDFAQFSACATGPGNPQLDPACAPAHFDDDGDVDQSDFGSFQRCYSGPNVAGDVNCAS